MAARLTSYSAYMSKLIGGERLWLAWKYWNVKMCIRLAALAPWHLAGFSSCSLAGSGGSKAYYGGSNAGLRCSTAEKSRRRRRRRWKPHRLAALQPGSASGWKRRKRLMRRRRKYGVRNARGNLQRKSCRHPDCHQLSVYRKTNENENVAEEMSAKIFQLISTIENVRLTMARNNGLEISAGESSAACGSILARREISYRKQPASLAAIGYPVMKRNAALAEAAKIRRSESYSAARYKPTCSISIISLMLKRNAWKRRENSRNGYSRKAAAKKRT